VPLMELPEVEKELWAQWKQHPVTKRLIAGLMNKREVIKEALVEGSYTGDEERLIGIGQAQALRDAVMYAIEDFDYTIKEDSTDVEGDSV